MGFVLNWWIVGHLEHYGINMGELGAYTIRYKTFSYDGRMKSGIRLEISRNYNRLRSGVFLDYWYFVEIQSYKPLLFTVLRIVTEPG